jgi:hypothetical protein
MLRDIMVTHCSGRALRMVLILPVGVSATNSSYIVACCHFHKKFLMKMPYWNPLLCSFVILNDWILSMWSEVSNIALNTSIWLPALLCTTIKSKCCLRKNRLQYGATCKYIVTCQRVVGLCGGGTRVCNPPLSASSVNETSAQAR